MCTPKIRSIIKPACVHNRQTGSIDLGVHGLDGERARDGHPNELEETGHTDRVSGCVRETEHSTGHGNASSCVWLRYGRWVSVTVWARAYHVLT